MKFSNQIKQSAAVVRATAADYQYSLIRQSQILSDMHQPNYLLYKG